MNTTYILTLSCADVRGIVAAVTGFLTREDGFIIESTQFGDPSTEQFFMRVQFAAGPKTPSYGELRQKFKAEVADSFGMAWEIADAARKARVVVLVSKQLHCLNDLLHRYRTGSLPMEIPAVISNHNDARGIVEWHGIPFHHLPIENGDKAAQEARIRAVIDAERADVVVLARYMQILSPELLPRAGRPRHQHPPQLPAQLQGRAALLPGACARRQADRRHRTLRDGRPGRRPDHRTGRAARGPHALVQQAP
jgi:formyltetrahydrofolate deformylase